MSISFKLLAVAALLDWIKGFFSWLAENDAWIWVYSNKLWFLGIAITWLLTHIYHTFQRRDSENKKITLQESLTAEMADIGKELLKHLQDGLELDYDHLDFKSLGKLSSSIQDHLRKKPSGETNKDRDSRIQLVIDVEEVLQLPARQHQAQSQSIADRARDINPEFGLACRSIAKLIDFFADRDRRSNGWRACRDNCCGLLQKIDDLIKSKKWYLLSSQN